jgi:hypothetical protein
LSELSGTGLSRLTAKTTDVVGIGIHFNGLNGFLGALSISNVGGGADIFLTGAPPATLKNPSVKISAGVIGDRTDITLGGAPLAKLTAIAVGDGAISAPGVGTIQVTGRKATKGTPAVAGDFKSDLTISGVGIDPVNGKLLVSLKVTGAVDGSRIVVGSASGLGANVGSVTVGAFRNSRLFAGYDGPDVPDLSGFHTPATITSFRSTGKVDGFQDSFVIATNFKSVSINNLDSTNAGKKFGFYAKSSLGAISVIGPTNFKYNPGLPTPQGQGDFEVELVT